MDVDRQEVYEGLIRWISSLMPDVGPLNAQMLLTGKPMTDALKLLVPEYFDEEWVQTSGVNVNEDANWRVKSNALKKLLKHLLDCYSEITGQPLSDENIPDANLAARDADTAELSKFLQLILAIAVNGSRRQTAIEHIMTLEESVQQVVMMAIKTIQERCRSASIRSTETFDADLDGKLKRLATQLEMEKESKEELARRCHELDQQIDMLQDEKRTLAAENDRLMSKLANSESSDESVATSSKRALLLQQEVETLQEELYRTETGQSELKIKCDSLVRENKELQARLDDLAANENEYRKLKDELDELRAKAVEAKKLETTLETYKRKFEEMTDLRLQLKILQEKNEAYMKCGIDLDEEQRRNSALKTQLEAYKRQLQDVEEKSSAETKRADKNEFEARRLQEKLEVIQQERERLIIERDGLREANDELKFSQLQTSGAFSGGNISDTSSDLEVRTDGTEMREQILQLQYENRALKQSLSNSRDETTSLMQSQLDDLTQRKQELETELRLSEKKVMEAEGLLTDMREQLLAGSGGSADARTVDLHRQIEYHSIEAQKARQRLIELEKTSNDKEQKVKSLEAQLMTKDAELKSQEAEYKSYLEKARTVMVMQEQPIGGSSVGMGYSRAEFDSLRRQVVEKDKIIQQMQEEQEKTRIMKEQEERLITTNYHNMAMQVHKRSTADRLSGLTSQSPSSFLARQREITSKRSQPHQEIGYRSFRLLALILLLSLIFLLFECPTPMIKSVVDSLRYNCRRAENMANFMSALYSTVFKRTSTMVAASVVAVFFFERVFEQSTSYVFDRVNEGKQWKDVKKRLQLE